MRHRSGWTAIALLLVSASCSPLRPVSEASPEQELLSPATGRVVFVSAARISPEAGTLSAGVRLSYVADTATARAAILLLNGALDVHSVAGKSVLRHRVVTSELSSAWNAIHVDLVESVAPGDVVTIDLTYSGAPSLPSDGINSIGAGWVELGLDTQWHPVFASLDKEMVGVLRLMLPPEWSVVASGSSDLVAGEQVVRFTVPQVDVAFTAAPRFRGRFGANTAVLHRTADSATVEAVLAAADRCAAYLDDRFGVAERLPRTRIVLAERAGPGYARKNYIVLSEVNAAQPEGLHHFLCHELAHFWTRSAGVFTAEHWMTEAFPEYVAARAVGDFFGEESYARQVSQWESASRGQGPVWTPASSNRPSFAVMYRLAPWQLAQLEQRIGREVMDRFLAGYMTRQLRRTTELLSMLESVAGPDTSRWFAEQLGTTRARAAAPR